MAKRREIRTRAAHVRDFLAVSPAAARCLEMQRREDALLARVRDLLAPAARPHCLHAQASEGTLTLTVDSTAWATRLRYEAPDLAPGLAEAGIARVKVRARPRPGAGDGWAAGQPTKLRPAAIDHLLAAADGAAEPEIAEVFRRLAGRHRDPGPGEPLT